MKYNEIKIGDKAIVVQKITEADIDKFVNLTDDDNKFHVNKEFAKKRILSNLLYMACF